MTAPDQRRAPTAVLKFGGSVLRDESDLERASAEIRAWIEQGFKVIAVVSAFEGTTDALVRRASAFGSPHREPDPAACALLTATGELTSASLLSLALNRGGTAASVAPPWTILLRAEGDPLDGFPLSVSKPIVDGLLATHNALVIPGFIALDSTDRVILLGRGGSDLSALFLAERLGADRCRLIKDVDGLYEYDPAAPEVLGGDRPAPRRYATLPWSEALKLDGGIVQHKAVRFALDRRLNFEVGPLGPPVPSNARPGATVVGDLPIVFAEGSARVRTGHTRPREAAAGLAMC